MIDRMIHATLMIGAMSLSLASLAGASDVQAEYGKPGQHGKPEQKGASYAEQKMAYQKGDQASKAEQKTAVVSKPDQKGSQAGKAEQKPSTAFKSEQKGSQAGKAEQKPSTGKGQQKLPVNAAGSQKGGQKSR